MFVHQEYGKISVEQYFKSKRAAANYQLAGAYNFPEQHNIDLTRPDAPLMDIGSKAKPNWVPSELCVSLPRRGA